MFHEYSDHDVDEHELRHEDKDDEEDGRNDGRHATVPLAVVSLVTIFSQCVLYEKNDIRKTHLETSNTKTVELSFLISSGLSSYFADQTYVTHNSESSVIG